MRKTLPAVLALVALVACSSSKSTPTQRYYDPQGHFSARLPTNDDVVQVPPQQLQGSPDLLSGVISLPAEPSPSASAGAFGGSFLQPVTQQDTAIYAVFAVKAEKDSTIKELATTLLGQTISPALLSQRLVTAAGLNGLLVVVDHNDPTGANEYTDASAFFIDGQVAFWIRELFAKGEWDSRRVQFIDVLRSFRPGAPLGASALPLTRPGLQIRSGIGWPLG